MTTVTGIVETETGEPDNRPWCFSSFLREASNGEIVTDKTRWITPVNGVLTVHLEPGPAQVAYGKKTYLVTVPDADIGLWDLIEAAVAVPPGTSDERLADAIAAYLDGHPAGGGLAALADDLTPQLGGNLDLGGHTVGAATAADLSVLHAKASVLGNTSGVNSGDQDLSGYATSAALSAQVAAAVTDYLDANPPLALTDDGDGLFTIGA